MRPNSEPFRFLQPGDPWTMILDEPISGAVVGGEICKWSATNEPGRIFRITAIHGATYETVYVGFEGFAQ